MKKKLMLSMLIILIFSLTIVTTLFTIIVNYQYMQSARQNLKSYNNLIVNVLKDKDSSNSNYSILSDLKDENIDITIFDMEGNTLFTSGNKITDETYGAKGTEFSDAMINGEGSSITYSNAAKGDILSYATVSENKYVIRSSISLKSISGFAGRYVKYYIVVVIAACVMALFFSSRISYVIVKPIKDLEYTTSRIAKGELQRRVNIYSKDEIGQLGLTFNNMAEKLQLTLNDVIDKQNRLEAILKSMDSGIIAIDKNDKVIMINPYAKDLFGIKKDVIGLNLMDCIRDFEIENIFKNTYENYKEIKIIWPKERNLRIKTADIINGTEKMGKVAAVQDITDIKKLENVRSQFVANVSHELKTPLTSIKGFAETLRYVEDEPTKEKFLNIINDEADRLTRLINDILELSDLESSKEFKEEDIDVNSVIKDVACLVKSSADKKNIAFNTDIKAVPIIKGDKDKLKQMLINLADNAIKYSESNASVTIGSEVRNDNCIIWVQDTGVGIPQEHISRLFERFYRVDKARSRAQGGTGLGLAIVKHIVMGFNGTIDVESEVGKGSKFTVKIPI